MISLLVAVGRKQNTKVSLPAPPVRLSLPIPPPIHSSPAASNNVIPDITEKLLGSVSASNVFRENVAHDDSEGNVQSPVVWLRFTLLHHANRDVEIAHLLKIETCTRVADEAIADDFENAVGCCRSYFLTSTVLKDNHVDIIARDTCRELTDARVRKGILADGIPRQTKGCWEGIIGDENILDALALKEGRIGIELIDLPTKVDR